MGAGKLSRVTDALRMELVGNNGTGRWSYPLSYVLSLLGLHYLVATEVTVVWVMGHGHDIFFDMIMETRTIGGLGAQAWERQWWNKRG